MIILKVVGPDWTEEGASNVKSLAWTVTTAGLTAVDARSAGRQALRRIARVTATVAEAQEKRMAGFRGGVVGKNYD
ncbi:MAG: hypothetical protein L0099_04090 [Acidobacteria bacterium]|nr:hypothetical protein [Acidobacteriota bacterium]